MILRSIDRLALLRLRRRHQKEKPSSPAGRAKGRIGWEGSALAKRRGASYASVRRSEPPQSFHLLITPKGSGRQPRVGCGWEGRKTDPFKGAGFCHPLSIVDTN